MLHFHFPFFFFLNTCHLLWSTFVMNLNYLTVQSGRMVAGYRLVLGNEISIGTLVVYLVVQIRLVNKFNLAN